MSPTTLASAGSITATECGYTVTGAATPEPPRVASNAAAAATATRTAAASGNQRRRSLEPVGGGGGSGRRAEGGILLQDRPFELAERRPRLDPELGAERDAAVAVDLERLGLAAGPVERRHQLPRMRSRSGCCATSVAQLAYERAVAAEREIGVDPVLERDEPELLEPFRLRPRERLVHEVGERGPAPEGEARPQPLRRGARVSVFQQPPALAGQPDEPVGVALLAARSAACSRAGATRAARASRAPGPAPAPCADARRTPGRCWRPSRAASRPRARRSGGRATPPRSRAEAAARGLPAASLPRAVRTSRSRRPGAGQGRGSRASS